MADGVTVHVMLEPHRTMKQIERVEVFTYTRGNLKTLEIEEVSLSSNWARWKGTTYTACRYLHAIFDKSKEVFTHTDGAVRLYSEEQFSIRQQKNLAQYGKDAHRVKTFLVNGGIDTETWVKTVHFYFSGNPLVGEYFGFSEHSEVGLSNGVQAGQ